MINYKDFVEKKSQLGGEFGFKPKRFPDKAFDFQKHLIEYACRQGRSAIFADCGLGKTLIQLAWADNVNKHTNKPVLVAAPLSVSLQTVGEGNKFGFDVVRSLNGKVLAKAGIVTTNYERLHHFNPDDFAGMVCDESSIIKNFDGVRKSDITEFMRLIKYRLLCTATPSPNDYIELGTSSEALGYLGHMDMLSMFFRNDEDSLHPAFIGSQWRFKPHAQTDFWRWVSSWARALRRPSDLGYSDKGWALPKLVERTHIIKSPVPDGRFFAVPLRSMDDQRGESRRTVQARCEKAAELINGNKCAVAWGHLNSETDLLTEIIDGAVQVSGADADERKEEVLDAFRTGQIQRLVTKPKIAAYGLNWQHCNKMTYFVDHSYEKYYQAVRRLWRFGQKHEVSVDLISTEALVGVAKNQQRKAAACEKMFDSMLVYMKEAMNVNRFSNHTTKQELPPWV